MAWRFAEAAALAILSMALIQGAMLLIGRWTVRRLNPSATAAAPSRLSSDERVTDEPKPPRKDRSAALSFTLLIILFVIALCAGLIGVIYWLADLAGLLTERSLLWFVPTLVVILAAARVYMHLAERKERREVERLRLPERMSRTQVVDQVQSFRFESAQQRLIRRLAARKIELTGQWPLFLDAQWCWRQCMLSELAKLEERGLKVDR